MPAPTVASALLLLLLHAPHGREQQLSTTAAHAHEFPEKSFNHSSLTKKMVCAIVKCLKNNR